MSLSAVPHFFVEYDPKCQSTLKNTMRDTRLMNDTYPTFQNSYSAIEKCIWVSWSGEIGGLKSFGYITYFLYLSESGVRFLVVRDFLKLFVSNRLIKHISQF